MLTHYQVLGTGPEATAEEIRNAYRSAAAEVMPKYTLYPTSVRNVEKCRTIQDAFDCLIKPESRAEYDAMLRELAAEEQSLFGERKARRQAKNAEEQRTKQSPPPYVWNEDTNSPLFWTPGRKLIEGPKSDPDAIPVAYFKRSSLEKALVKVTPEPAPVAKTVTPPKRALRAIMPPPAPTPAPATQEKPKVRPAIPSQPSYFSGQHHQPLAPSQYYSTPGGWQNSAVAIHYLHVQKAKMQAAEERHRQHVEEERVKALRDLEKRRRAVERERKQSIQVEHEVRRRLLEKEREMAAKYAERMRIKEAEAEKENERRAAKSLKNAQKQVRWGYDNPRVPLEQVVHFKTGTYDGWYSEPELPRTRHNVLKKRRAL